MKIKDMDGVSQCIEMETHSKGSSIKTKWMEEEYMFLTALRTIL
jgi:hypothetical protein